nr:glycosyltransferase family 39 protein [candidate division Zixibacteria bacterium]
MSLNQIGYDGLMYASPDAKLYVNMGKSLVNGTNSFEHGFFIFGPGFAYFLASFFKLFGKGLFPYILFQIIVSGMSCLLIYRLCMELTDSYRISILSAILAVISYTSITLSIVILSDTVYMFVFLLSLIYLVRGLRKMRWRYFIICGFFAGLAGLIRSIGQFWPLMILLMGIPYYHFQYRRLKSGAKMKTVVFRLVTAAIIATLIMSFWVIRNYRVHDIPALASAGVMGAAKVAALSLEKIENRPMAEIRREWITEYTGHPESTAVSLEESFHIEIDKTRETFFKHPGPMLRRYIGLTWDNLNATNFYHRILLPQCQFLLKLEHKINHYDLNFLNFWISLTGMVVLIIRRQFRVLIILGGVYIYYALLIGFNPWQGSRVFFPGQIAWTMLISIVLVNLYDFLKKYLARRYS